MTLRDYQSKAITDISAAFRQHRRVLFVLPTGGGKTAIMSVIAQRAAGKGKRVLILVHRIELLRQTIAALGRVGVTAGVVNPNYSPNYLLPVQVGMVQTVVKRLHYFRQGFDLVLTDEAHHAPAGNYVKILTHFGRAFSLGVTATPVRSDGKGLRDCYDTIVQGPTIAELIERGYLVQPIVYAPATAVDLSGVRTRMGDYDKEALNTVMDKPKITGDAVDYYRRMLNGLPAVVFCVSVAHAQHVAEQFREAGFRSESVDGSMELADRARILDGLGTGAVQVVTSCDIVSEGTDIPAIAGAILLRPTQSTGLFMQQVGRALRTVEGKEHAIILDHVGNCLRHGMPDDERSWSLEGETRGKRKRDDEDVKAKQCKKCYAIFSAALRACPQCSAEVEGKPREIEQVSGELVQVTDAKRQLRSEVGRARTLEALRAIGEARGYKRGWAERVWESRQQRR
jgi:superfamily II DNA or RNA helicase